MTRIEILDAIAEINPELLPQVRTLLDCRARFCKITMKPDPVQDAIKRNGRQRVFLVNVRATYAHMMKRHVDPSYRFDPFFESSTLKARRTCTKKGILGVVENANEGGRTVLQYRNVDLRKIQSIQCGDIMESFV